MRRLPYLVEVQERTEQPDADGGTSEFWRTVAVRSANVENFSADEKVEGVGVAQRVRARVTLRGQGLRVTGQHRIVFRGRALRVEGVVREERSPGVQVATCVEVENDG